MGTSIERGTSMANELARKIRSTSEFITRLSMARMWYFYCTKIFQSIADWCREESRPFFRRSADTYRYKGHSMSDPRKYTDSKEEEAT